jgi:predicted ATP-grasp superfamily ATP-dependent carboligase
MRVLLLDGQVNPAVTAVRSLGRAGHRVEVGSSGTWSKAGWSRYASESFVYPSADENAGKFAAAIAARAGRENGTLVLPITEKTVMALSEHRALIEDAGGRMVMPGHAAMMKAYDKAQTTRIASQLGVASPRTCLMNDEESAHRIAAEFPYPAAIKARTSVELAGGRVRSTARPLYARDPVEFLQAYRRLHERASQVIAQEFIDGGAAIYCLLLCRGQLRAEFAYQRIRSVHPTGWGAALRVSVPADGLREGSLRIIRALDPQWTGLASVEYRVREDGAPFFLEVNPRTWNSLALAVYAGVDFPRMLAEIAEHGDVAVHAGYPPGVVCRWWLGDLRRLLFVWQGVSRSYPGKTQGRLAALAHFLKPVPRAFHDNFTPADPLPELGDWLGAAGRALRRISGRRVAT